MDILKLSNNFHQINAQYDFGEAAKMHNFYEVILFYEMNYELRFDRVDPFLVNLHEIDVITIKETLERLAEHYNLYQDVFLINV